MKESERGRSAKGASEMRVRAKGGKAREGWRGR